uniref:Uncharacterized protein n=1 Tax=Anguilla anguilla TaxID=7936 RepID=A0A0E9Q1Q9_ANGAN
MFEAIVSTFLASLFFSPLAKTSMVYSFFLSLLCVFVFIFLIKRKEF